MTFLLFLVSVVVIECILRREKSGKRLESGRRVSAHEGTANTGLASLAETVEGYGRGPSTGTEGDERVMHKSEADRV